jgi:hypothetical protein
MEATCGHQETLLSNEPRIKHSDVGKGANKNKNAGIQQQQQQQQ